MLLLRKISRTKIQWLTTKTELFSIQVFIFVNIPQILGIGEEVDVQSRNRHVNAFY